MKTSQKYSPKYWVIHDKTTDDAYIDTLSKSMEMSINLFHMNYEGVVWDSNSNLEATLIEIKEVL